MKERGFASTVRPDHAETRAGGEIEIDPVRHHDRAEFFRQPPNFEQIGQSRAQLSLESGSSAASTGIAGAVPL